MNLSLRIALLLAATAPLAAQAADYDPPIFVEEAAEYVPVEVGSGWYLRGDVGYVFDSSIDGVDYTAFDGVGDVSASFNSASIDTDFTWGGGFGYRFTDYFRADATIDGFRADFDGSTSSGVPCLADPDVGTTCRSENSSEVSAISVMANGYVDLGTYVGFTPYVGAGAGMSYVSWHDLNDRTYCVDGLALCASDDAVGSTSHGGEDGWRFTYALMAGVAYDISKNFKLDVGYKYRNIDGGDMFGWDSGDTFGDGTYGNIETHEVRLGLRYELW
ncbi:outer membrane protein [Mesorhizobium sp. KR9-304]|uniref:outer membrane protein n=1 Tax=Mesorhizobium sp. KR9-304 TaxID=3156614 RepID=UPI0032B37DEB